MKLYDTFKKTVAEFEPIEESKVSMYTCGPTVYNFAHIGNFRTYLFEDFLRRGLEYLGNDVVQVMNMTDVDDKTIKAAEGRKAEFSELTKKYEDAFLADLESLNIEKPSEITRATDYIEQIVAFVSDLLERGFAYKGDDGSIYFSIEKFKEYGKLSGLDKDGIKSGARVAQDEYSKENPADFALWKAWDDADGEIFWDTKLGKGRPGWHIECSAMSQDKLGDSIDIHAGAVDLIFPHHENEIAQSEARTGKKFVNYWIHGEHLLVDGKKMSKSLGNIYLLSDLKEKGFSPLDFRYLCLTAKYRDKLNFTWDSLETAKNSLARAKKIVGDIESEDKINAEYIAKFKSALENDLNIPEALAVFWTMLRDNNLGAGAKKATALEMDKVFGLGLGESNEINIPSEVAALAEERLAARKEKDFGRSDELRKEIDVLGYTIEDSGDSYKIYKK